MRTWSFILAKVAIFSLLCLGRAHAQNEFALQSGPPQPNDCVSQAAEYHSVNSWIVRAIIKVESNFDPKAINKNKNGTVDVGAAQINSMHFKELNKYGVGPSDLMDACISSYVAAWHLRKQVRAYGNTWFAVGAYHSATPCYNKRYTGLVWNVLLKWNVVQGAKATVGSMASCDGVKSASVSPSKGAGSSAVLDID